MAILGLLGLLIGACAPATASPSLVPSAVVPSATVVASGSAVVVEGPPAAALAAEGGDPVLGQLGTYVWHDQGSDSPWLPGTPVNLGKGEPLSVGLAGQVPIGAWSARARPAGTTLPAQPLGRGTLIAAFAAPAAGTWSIAVEITFADGSGIATYFWELHIE